MPVDIGVTVKGDLLDEIARVVAKLTSLRVLVGIPAEDADRDNGGAINNATLGYIMETGAPAANIPARPHLVPGVSAYAPKAAARLKLAGQAALEGRTPDVDRQLNAIGLEAVASVKALIVSNIPPPLKPATLAARKRRGMQGETALIDTGDYLRHITYVIRKISRGRA